MCVLDQFCLVLFKLPSLKIIKYFQNKKVREAYKPPRDKMGRHKMILEDDIWQICKKKNT